MTHDTRATRWPAHIIIPSAVGLAAAAVIVVSARQALRPAVPVTVRPAWLAQSPGATTVQAPGWLEADPFYIACSALADGVVEQVLVLEGEPVEAGQVVARLVAADAELALAGAEADVATAQADLAVAEADQRAARTNWEQPVQRERAVGVWRAAHAETVAELDQLPALIAVEQAVHDRLVEELARARTALDRGGATDIEVIILDRQVAAQAATVESIQRREAMLAARRDRLAAEVRAAERDFELRVEERRALDAAEARVMRARAEVARATARRDEASLRLERMTIRAPITGLVQRRLKVPGDKIMLGMDDPRSAQLALLYDPAKLQVRVDVPLADAAGVTVGQGCEVVVDILPDRAFDGVVTRITHEAVLQKNTLQVKVRVLDPSPLLKPEMLTRVRFLDDVESPGEPGASANPAPGSGGLIVPVECLDIDGRRVWAIRDRRGRQGRAVPVPVTIDGRRADWALVRGDLRPGELLAVTGEPLRAGQPVRMEFSVRGGRS